MMNLASGLLNPGYMALDGEDWPMMPSRGADLVSEDS